MCILTICASLQAVCSRHLPCSWQRVVHICRCIFDVKPRKLDAEACNLMCNLAETTVRELERQNTFITRTLSGMKAQDPIAQARCGPRSSLQDPMRSCSNMLCQIVSGEMLLQHLPSTGQLEPAQQPFELLHGGRCSFSVLGSMVLYGQVYCPCRATRLALHNAGQTGDCCCTGPGCHVLSPHVSAELRL